MGSNTETHEAQHEHPPHLAHHFDTPQQQFDSGKLGTWLFLNTEILLFAVLFCLYTLYRANHPEVFEYAHLYLDRNLGALNTMVLIFSSFTMAMGVRCAQTSNKKGLVLCLSLTLLCGFGFLAIKGIEYKAKFEHGVLPGQYFNPNTPPGAHHEAAKLPEAAAPLVAAAAPVVAPAVPAAPAAPKGPLLVEKSALPEAAIGPRGRASAEAAKVEEGWHGPAPANVHIFFSIYWIMTGLHGLHVIAGMGLIAWILKRSIKGEFSSEYYNPVDFVGLYWHLVDLIWIFLFPLLYLIK